MATTAAAPSDSVPGAPIPAAAATAPAAETPSTSPAPDAAALSPRSAARVKEREQRAAARDAERATKRAERDKARAAKDAERERLRALKQEEKRAAREKRRHEAELRRAGKPVPGDAADGTPKPECHSSDDTESSTDDSDSDEDLPAAAAAAAAAAKPAAATAATGPAAEAAADEADAASAAAAAAAAADARCGLGPESNTTAPTPAAAPAPTPAKPVIPEGPVAIEQLPPPAGAQACIAMPIAAMHNIRTKKHAWNVIQKQYSKHNENNTLEDTPEGLCMRVNYPAESCNPGAAKKGQRPLGGMGFQAAPLEVFPAHDVELKYSLQFDESFQPQKGGKLPGLMMAEAGDCKGGASGGRHSDNKASLRLMWRADFQAEAYVYATAAAHCPEYNHLESCHYNPAYGDSIWRGLLNFKPKVWNQVAVRARLNTPGQPDGLLRLTVNGETKQFDKMMWRKDDSLVITSLFFSTFYGGSKPDWACPVDTCIRFKDFVLTKFA